MFRRPDTLFDEHAEPGFDIWLERYGHCFGFYLDTRMHLDFVAFDEGIVSVKMWCVDMFEKRWSYGYELHGRVPYELFLECPPCKSAAFRV